MAADPSPFDSSASHETLAPPDPFLTPLVGPPKGALTTQGTPAPTSGSVVYTDPTGKGYDTASLAAAWGNGSLSGDPLNARVPDILSANGTPTTPGSTASPTYSPTGGVWNSGGSSIGLQDPQSSAFYDMLLKKASATPNVDPNNPVIKAQVNAYDANQQRTGRDYLSTLAEKGGPNTNLGAEARLSAENRGAATSGFQATLQGQEIAAQRNEIQQALQLGAQFLTAQQQMSLQARLKELDIQQQQFDRQQRASEFDTNTKQNAYQFDVNDAYRNSPFAPGATA